MGTEDEKKFIGDIEVTLRPQINDPQGITVRTALNQLGFDMVTSVRIGHYYELQLTADSPDQAGKTLAQIGKTEVIYHSPAITDVTTSIRRPDNE